MKTFFKKEKGYATFLSLLILCVLSVLVFSFLEVASTQLHSLKVYKDSFQTSANADSGIEDLISKYYRDILYEENSSLQTNTVDCSNQFEYTQSFANGTYTVCIKELEGKTLTKAADCNNDGIDEITVTQREVELRSIGKTTNQTAIVTATLQLKKEACTNSTFVDITHWNQEK